MGCRVIFSCLKELARHLDLPPAPPGEDGDTGDADDDVAAKDASADDTQDADGGGGDKGDGAADGSAAVGKSESKRSTPNDNDIPAKQSANDTPSNAPANTTTAGKILGHAGALKRGMFSLGGKIISPLTSRGKAADTDTSGGKGGDGDEGGKSAGKKAATKMEAKDLKGLIGDVVLLGAPVDLRVITNFISALHYDLFIDLFSKLLYT